MPTALLPCVRKIIHRISDFVRPQEGEHAKSEEQHCHQQCCGCIGTTWERPLHVYKLHQLTPERYANCCEQAIAQACAVCSPFCGAMSEIAMFRQLTARYSQNVIESQWIAKVLSRSCFLELPLLSLHSHCSG